MCIRRGPAGETGQPFVLIVVLVLVIEFAGLDYEHADEGEDEEEAGVVQNT